MRVLTLTWEFPPVITGGLGMACYGIIKSLLKQGMEVDVILPAKEAVYFPMRRPEDADAMPAVFSAGGKQMTGPKIFSVTELRKIVGSPMSVYHTGSRKFTVGNPKHFVWPADFKDVLDTMTGDYNLMNQVRSFTEMAVDMGSKLKFDVIHAHDWLTYPAGMILQKITGKPLVSHVHSTEFDRAGGAGDSRVHHIEYLGLEQASKVIAVSAYTARIVEEKYRINPKKITVVHNAYHVVSNGNNNGRIFREKTVLFLGRITLQKGPDYFLEVARRIIQEYKNVQFIMAGSGDMERQIMHKAAWYGLGTKLLFAGFLNRQEVDSILAATDIFVLPSVSEPFGIAPLEAMSRGAVPIVSKNSGVSEIINNCYKIDFWDIDQMVRAILELLKNPNKFREMSRAAKAEVANLEWDSPARKISNVYREAEERMSECLV